MFKINNVANTAFKAKLLDRQINSNEVITIDDWLDGAIQPTFVRQQEKFKEITMVVLIEGANEEDAYKMFSKLTRELSFGELKFDDMSLTFKVMINGAVSPKRLKPNVFEVDYKLKSSYGMASRQSLSREAGAAETFTINNLGTAETPCIIEITPTQNISSLTFEGFTDKPFTVKNIVSGQKVVINGEANTILMNRQNGFKNFDGWSFPSLIPGENNLKVSSTLGYSMVIKYNARFI